MFNLALALLVGLGGGVEAGKAKGMELTSPQFSEGRAIPRGCTCDGADESPALQWTKAPKGTQSFALVCDDPDALPVAGRVWVHWVAWNIPAGKTGLAAQMPKAKILPDGTRQGRTDSAASGYSGPCPPKGQHRYYFKLYALASLLDLPDGSTKADLEKAMKGKVLSEATLMGVYARK